MSDDEQPKVDQQLEDIERSFRVASLTYNDPFGFLKTGEQMVAAQRKFLFGSEEE